MDKFLNGLQIGRYSNLIGRFFVQMVWSHWVQITNRKIETQLKIGSKILQNDLTC